MIQLVHLCGSAQRILLRITAILVLATALRVQVSAEETFFWEQTAPPNQGDMISAIVATDDGSLFAAMQSGALYSSENNGASWQPHTAVNAYTFHLAVTGDALYRSTEYGLMVSTDKGESWQQSGGHTIVQPKTFFASDNGALFAGTIQNGLFRSADNGQTWQQVLETAEISSIVENKSGVLFAAVAYPAEFGSGEITADSSGIYRSTDGGTTWLRTGLTNRLLVTLSISTNGELIAGSQETGGIGRVFRSEDNGDTWNTTTLQDITTSLTALADGSFMATAANSGIYRSTDGGKTWSPTNGGITDSRVMGMAKHPDGHLFAFDVWGTLYRSSIPVATGIPSANHQSEIPVRVAPHPVADEAVLFIATHARENIHLTLFDEQGHVVSVPIRMLSGTSEQRIYFSMRGLAAGVYFYRIDMPSSVQTGSIAVVR